MILLSQELLLLILKTQNSCSKSVKHSLLGRSCHTWCCCLLLQAWGYHGLDVYCAKASQLNAAAGQGVGFCWQAGMLALIYRGSCRSPLRASSSSTQVKYSASNNPPQKLHGLPLFVSNYAAKIFYFFHKQVEICSFLDLLNFTIQNMYDSPDNGMIYVTPQTFGLWKLFTLPTTVGTSVRERVIPLLQSKEIYTRIGEMGMAKWVHRVIIQILVLKVCISSQKLTAERFHEFLL